MRQSISHLLLITCAIILFSCKTQFVQKSYEIDNISVSEEVGSMDSTIVALYSPYKNILEKDMNRVLAIADNELVKDKPESLLTNFLGDLLLEQGTNIAKQQDLNLVPDVSFFNYGGIRSSLPKGEITVGNIFELMPFENEMVMLQLNGLQMQAFLDYIAAHGGGSVGGVNMLINDDKATNVKIGEQTLDYNKNYWLVTNDYVAAGGDGLEMLEENQKYINSGYKIRDAIIVYLEELNKKNEHVSPTLDGRIRYE
ncbi:5'-nucleotidase C-terminal domain-containing protein [uncultured Draconibacterium sp.]|uniref:5'-nucleotidase C-terminal domain-containing protein n=1 Tax=uncultured Draconibacterium sp. TaxID=1573823 RepID=UPI002AA74B46|nr:5'-nucleotidase C-terminal domain-containing protein [uncultured Draconibacterium sp.]